MNRVSFQTNLHYLLHTGNVTRLIST